MLLKILELSVADPDGASIYWILNQEKRGRFDAVSLIKLERLGLVGRFIVAGMDEEYYALSLTADGTDYLLENEQEIRRVENGGIETALAKSMKTDDFDDDNISF